MNELNKVNWNEYTTYNLGIESTKAEPLALALIQVKQTLNEAIDRVNELDKALDLADTQNLLLNERVAKLEAKYEGHIHSVSTEVHGEFVDSITSTANFYQDPIPGKSINNGE